MPGRAPGCHVRDTPPRPGTGHGGSPCSPHTPVSLPGTWGSRDPQAMYKGGLVSGPSQAEGGPYPWPGTHGPGAILPLSCPGLRVPRPGGSSCSPGTVRRHGSCKGCRVSLQKMTPRERVATSKSRGEKSRLPTVATARADVVPGRLPEAEWLSLLEAERRDRDAGDILAELLGRVMDECTKADVARQVSMPRPCFYGDPGHPGRVWVPRSLRSVAWDGARGRRVPSRPERGGSSLPLPADCGLHCGPGTGCPPADRPVALPGTGRGGDRPRRRWHLSGGRGA